MLITGTDVLAIAIHDAYFLSSFSSPPAVIPRLPPGVPTNARSNNKSAFVEDGVVDD